MGEVKISKPCGGFVGLIVAKSIFHHNAKQKSPKTQMFWVTYIALKVKSGLRYAMLR